MPAAPTALGFPPGVSDYRKTLYREFSHSSRKKRQMAIS
jgi:hypothetical protein